jgi:hypothetical protein
MKINWFNSFRLERLRVRSETPRQPVNAWLCGLVARISDVRMTVA